MGIIVKTIGLSYNSMEITPSASFWLFSETEIWNILQIDYMMPINKDNCVKSNRLVCGSCSRKIKKKNCFFSGIDE